MYIYIYIYIYIYAHFRTTRLNACMNTYLICYDISNTSSIICICVLINARKLGQKMYVGYRWGFFRRDFCQRSESSSNQGIKTQRRLLGKSRENSAHSRDTLGTCGSLELLYTFQCTHLGNTYYVGPGCGCRQRMSGHCCKKHRPILRHTHLVRSL
jgi:hypothetical protein